MSQADPYADWDAAYVLGALPVQQRHAYEEHLADCADCRAAVAELAGMPGLLSQLPAAEAMALNDHGAGGPGDVSPVPDSIASMSPPRPRAWARVLVAASVVLALILGGIAGYALRAATEPSGPGSQSSAPTSMRVAFTAVNTSELIAVADLVPDAGGTAVEVQCQHAGSSSGSPSTGGPGAGGPNTGGTAGSGYGGGVSYVLWAVDTSGKRYRGDSWPAASGVLITSRSHFAIPLSKIKSLQIGPAATGDVLMWARV